MRLEDFDYPLDASLIAQQPVEPRHDARLMVLERQSGVIRHERVSDLPGILTPGDLLILNDTRVFPARLFGTKKPSGGKVELLLVRRLARDYSAQAGGETWQVLARGKIQPGQLLELPEDIIVMVLSSEGGRSTVAFPRGLDVLKYAERAGTVPLPPYIRRTANAMDRDRYQTIFASRPGAVAAPTAGLHFTTELLHRLTARGVLTATVTLHVGPGTFKPVTSPDIREHDMEPESYELPEETAKSIAETRERGGRIIAVGSTSVRVLETAAAKGLPLTAGSGETDLFIYPGYTFKVVNGMLTNFHLPKSTLFILVCALAGRERILEAYHRAAADRYRFYSYGDAMLVL
jgi:S-adenosylmethionine:tRNA ribosyltransferase-isomerase